MASNALDLWNHESLSVLRGFAADCIAWEAAVPANRSLADEYVKSYAVLVCSHFQGFCRNLYGECSQFVASQLPPAASQIVQLQFASNVSLNRKNATRDTITEDFSRFIAGFDLGGFHPSNRLRLGHLSDLNRFRNDSAHGNPRPARFPSTATIQGYLDSCRGLASSLDRMLYDALQGTFGVDPWPP